MRKDLAFLSSFIAVHFLGWHLLLGFPVLSSFFCACGSVFALFFIVGWILFGQFNEDVPKLPAKATWGIIGGIVGFGLVIWLTDLLTVLMDYAVIISTILSGGLMFAFYWFIYSEPEHRKLFIQSVIFASKVSAQTWLNLFVWCFSYRALMHMKDQIFYRHRTHNHEERALEITRIYGSALTQPNSSGSTASQAPGFDMDVPQAYFNPSLNTTLEKSPLYAEILKNQHKFYSPEWKKGEKTNNHNNKQEEENEKENESWVHRTKELMVNPSFRFAKSSHDFYYTVMKPLGLDPFNITAHDVLGPVVHLMGGGGGQFWFSYCFTPTDDKNCLPDGFFFPLRSELRFKTEGKRKKKRERMESAKQKEKESEEETTTEKEEEKEQESKEEERESEGEKKKNSELEAWVERGQVFGFAAGKKLKQLRPGMVVTMKSLQEGSMQFTPAQIERMCLAEILVPLGYPDYQRKKWQKQIARAKAEMADVGYTVLRNLLPPLQLEAFRSYCRKRKELDDISDSSNGYIFKWKDSVATMFNCLFTKVIEEVTGEELLPIQSLILFYGEGSFLDVHVDWHPFAFSFSYAVDVEEETTTSTTGTTTTKGKEGDKKKAWPLSVITKKSEPHVVDLELLFGEGILFKGQEMPHYRDRLPLGRSLISVSFSFDRKNRY